MRVYLATLLAIFLVACGQPEPVETPPSGDGDPQGDWQLVAGTVNGEPVPIPGEHRITLTIEGSSIGGSAACNSYGGKLAVQGGRLRIEDLFQTGMACLDEGAMAAEAIYMSGLGVADFIELDGEQLVISGPGVELRFEGLAPPPTAELVDTIWLLETFVSGEAVSAPVGEEAMLELRSDGTLSGSTGCRSFEGTWVEQGDEIVTPSLATTDEACPPELQDADSHVLSVVGDGFRASVEGDRLTLTDDGGLGLVYRASE